MSYRAGRRRRGLGDASGISVGAAAFGNPVLARASLDASDVMLAVAKAPVEQRHAVLQQKLDQLQPGLWPAVATRYAGNLKDRNQGQAMFDAIRSVLAERVYKRVLPLVRTEVGSKYGWDTVLDTPLGDLSPDDQAIGCQIAGGASTVGGIVSIIPVWGTLIGGATAIGAQVAGGAMACNAGQQALANQVATAQAQQAQIQLQAAAAAAADAQAARQRLIVYGGGILGAAAIAWWVLS